MNESPLDDLRSVPDPIVRTLKLLIRRSRGVILLRGLSAVAATGIGALLAVMAVDAGVVLFSAWSRWALSLAAYAATAASAAWFLIRPLARSFTFAGVARVIEVHHPELQERISSTVELLTSSDSPELRGSDALIDALAQEAIRDVRVVRPGQEVSLRASTPFLAAALILAAAMAVLFLSSPRKAAFLLARAVAPFANLPNARAIDLAVAPGDVVVAKGERLEIVASVRNRPVNRVRLRKTLPNGRESEDGMVPVTGVGTNAGRFAIQIPSVDASFRYRVQAGDALSRYYQVTAVTPPIVERLDLSYRFPEYSGIPPMAEGDSSGNIRALAGSEVIVRATVNKILPSAVMTIESPTSAVAMTGSVARAEKQEISCVFTAAVTPGLAGVWTLRLTDEHGLTNSRFERSIRAVPDNAPIVKVKDPGQKELHLNPDDRLPVLFSAEDDVGLKRVEMVVEADGVRLPDRSLPIPVDTGKTVKATEGRSSVDLAAPELAGKRRITFQIRAADNLPPDFKGPQFGLSEPYVILVDANAPSYPEQVLSSQKDRIRFSLERAQKELTDARSAAVPLKAAVSKDNALTDADNKQAATVREHLVKADGTIRDLSDAIKDGFYDDMAKKLRTLADDPLTRARNSTDRIPLVDTPEERGAVAGEAIQTIDQSLDTVGQMLKELDALTAAARTAMALQKLAEKQAKLADSRLEAERAAANPADTNAAAAAAAKAAWEKAQATLAGDLAKIVRETPQAPDRVAASVEDLAARAADEAAELAAKQRALADELRRMEEQRQGDQALRELAAQQAKLAGEARTNAPLAVSSAPMTRAATDISANQLTNAVMEQKAAETLLTNAVAQLQRIQPATPFQQQQIQKALELARRQADLRNRTNQALAARQAALQAQREEEARSLAAQQERLANEARADAATVPQATPMARAAESLKAGRIGDALKDQGEAAKALAATSRQLSKDPQPPAQVQAEKAERLGGRQEDLRERTRALQMEREAAEAAQRERAIQDLAAQQADLAAEAAARETTVPQAEPMKKAAEALKARELGDAIRNQDAAQQGLTNAAGQLARQQQASARQAGEEQRQAEKAAELAKRQDDLNRKAAALRDAAKSMNPAQRAARMKDMGAQEQKLAEEAAKEPAIAPQAQAMARAADAFKENQLGKAMVEQRAAQAGFTNAVSGLMREQKVAARLAAEQQQQADAAGDLARRQEQLRKKAEELETAQAPNPEKAREEAMKDLAEQQGALAEEAKEEKTTAPQAAPMARAAAEIDAAKLGDAMDDQRRAQAALAVAAEQMRDQQADTAQQAAEQQRQSEEAAELAKRQEELNRKAAALQAAAAANPAQHADQMKELAAQQEKLAQAAKKEPGTAAPSEAMAKAADALKAGQMDQAVQEQKGAQTALGAAAAQLAKDRQASDAQAAGERRQAEKAEDLARRQEQLLRRTGALQAQDGNAEAANRDRKRKELAAQEEALANEARKEPVMAPHADPMMNAATAIKDNQLGAAAQEQDKAQSGLAKLAGYLNREKAAATQTAAMQQQQAKRVGDLAKRQEELQKRTGDAAAPDPALTPEQRAARLGELAGEQEKLANEAKGDAAAAAPAAAMARAAEELKAKRPGNAVPEQSKAGQALARMADQLGAEQRGFEEKAATRERQGQKAADLARQQEDLKKRTDALRAADVPQVAVRSMDRLHGLVGEQNEMAAKTEALAGDVARRAPQGDRLETQASADAREAARELENGNVAPSSQAAGKAESGLRQLARRLEDAAASARDPSAPTEDRANGTGNKPAPRPGAEVGDLADQAGKMAERQGQLAREIAALARGDPLDQMAEKQRSLTDRVEELGQAADQMRNQTRDLALNPQAQQQAAQGAGQVKAALDQAHRAMQQFGYPPESAASPKPARTPGELQSPPAVEQAQQAAAQALEQAAQALSGLERSLRQGSLPQAGAPVAQEKPSEAAGRNLPESYQHADKAAETQRAIDAIQAAERLAEAAKLVTAQATAMGINPNPQQMNTSASAVVGGAGDIQVAAAGEGPEWMRKLGSKLRDWLRLRGELRDDVLQGATSKEPEEYRPLIRRYFEEVSKRGGDQAE